jgi:lipoteichoic acid synthase
LNRFDEIHDFRSVPCSRPVFGDRKLALGNLQGIDDRCTADAVYDWISAADIPFLAVLWSNQTHAPYYTRRSQPGESDLDRYKAALAETDHAVGELLRRLQMRGILEQTLVVVTADHGQAFGEHGQRFHASRIYDENVRIPLIFHHSASMPPGQTDSVAGLVDIAPSIFDWLGIEGPAGMDGQSIFCPDRRDRVYFGTVWSGIRLGLREGDRKFILNLAENTLLQYDLRRDPLERQPIPADELTRSIIEQRLAAWVQSRNALR